MRLNLEDGGLSREQGAGGWVTEDRGCGPLRNARQGRLQGWPLSTLDAPASCLLPPATGYLLLPKPLPP